MVKNAGGNKSKKIARKNVSYSTRDVRRATDENEMYAVVSKIYSSQRCSVTGTDGKTYQCKVRGKFLNTKSSGIGELSIGVWVLIGFYEWEVRSDGSKNCDLLEIYTSVEKDKLKQIETRNLSVLMKIDGNERNDGNELTFSNFNVKEELSGDEDFNKDKNDEESNPTKDVSNNENKIKPNSYTSSPYKKETVEEQMDWLSVNVNDI